MSDIRPGPRLNKELAAQLLLLIRAGNTLLDSAQSVGISVSTIHNWIRWGKTEKKNQYTAFYAEVLKAQAEANVADFNAIGLSDDWKAKQYRLAVRNPKTYALRTRVAIEFEKERELLLAVAEKVLNPNDFLRLLEEYTAEVARRESEGEGGGTEVPIGSEPEPDPDSGDGPAGNHATLSDGAVSKSNDNRSRDDRTSSPSSAR